jgi:hypothetical protein
MSEQVSSGGSFPPPPVPTPNVAPPVQAAAPVVRRGNGKLTGAGVLQIIQGALSAIIGLWLFSVTQSEVGGFVDDLSGGSLTFMAVIMVAIGVALIWVAILCIKARKGGWVTTVVFQSIFTFFGVLAVIGASSEGNPVGGAVITVVYCGIALFLAASGGKQSTR